MNTNKNSCYTSYIFESFNVNGNTTVMLIEERGKKKAFRTPLPFDPELIFIKSDMNKLSKNLHLSHQPQTVSGKTENVTDKWAITDAQRKRLTSSIEQLDGKLVVSLAIDIVESLQGLHGTEAFNREIVSVAIERGLAIRNLRNKEFLAKGNTTQSAKGVTS